MRQTVLAVIFLTAVVGCAREASAPISPPLEGLSQTTLAQEPNDPHRLFGEWTFFIDAEHERVDVVPRREGRFHLNALKFLESYCTDCLKITGIKNNGDSTIDLTVQITHPFKGYPEYTGFDVKGIIMFNGSYEYPNKEGLGTWNYLPEPTFRVSWRLRGDPELINADGYTPRWRPNWDEGSDKPIFKYWNGKYSSGTPNADLNAFLNFYSQEERHMFSVNSSVSRTYKIWLPPGQPVIAGYAVEACWEPPTVIPVKNPLTDFPTSANQPEPYHLKWVVNNGEPVKAYSECCQGNGDCSDMRVEVKQWGGITVDRFIKSSEEPFGQQGALAPCEPPQEDVLSNGGGWDGSVSYPPGKYQWFYTALEQHWPMWDTKWAYTILEFEVIE
jgi:hypothetical protein